MDEVRKVIGYITKKDKLLVFIHPNSPEVSLQVPSGTVIEGESLEEAVVREVREETGLTDVKISSYLGESRFSQPSGGKEIIRHFFHLNCHQETPPRWKCEEKDPSEISEDEDLPIIFELYWIPLPEGIVELPTYYGQFLYKIL